jgi:HK97 gp10 family phage protein
MIQAPIQGFKELERQLTALERKTGKKIVRKAVRKSLKPVHTVAKEKARSMVGGNMGSLLAKNIVLRAMRKQRRGSFAMNVRLRAGINEFIHKAQKSKYPGGETFIPAAIEYGHDNAAPIPFMRTASDENLPKAEGIMRQELKAGIETTAKHGN